MLAKKERVEFLHHWRPSRKGKTCLSGSAKNSSPLSVREIACVIFWVSFWLYTSGSEKEVAIWLCWMSPLLGRTLLCDQFSEFLSSRGLSDSSTLPAQPSSLEKLCVCIIKLSLTSASRRGASSKSEDKNSGAEACFFKLIHFRKSIFRLGGCKELYPRRGHAMCLCRELLL